MKRGEIYWVRFHSTVGSEVRKTRPAVILSNNAANSVLPRVVVIPITSQTAKLYPGEALVTVGDKQGKAMADQIMAVDKQRLGKKMGALSNTDLNAVEEALLSHLEIKLRH